MPTRMTLVMVALVLVVSCANADSYRVFGTITTDAGDPLVGVRVSISGADEVAITDARGEYEVAGIPSGTSCTIRPSRSGYSFKPASREVTITSGDEWANFTAADAQAGVCGVASGGGDLTALAIKGPAVTYPSAAGITWRRDHDYTITWQGFSTANVRIQLWKSWSLDSTITTGTINDGSYTWTVPDGIALGTDYLIRVSETGTGWTPDFSNNYFAIAAAATPRVTYPSAAGITWTRGDDYTITWKNFSTANVRIQLWKGWSLVSTITSGTLNDGSYVWTVPTGTALGTNYRIRVSETGTGWRPDFSNNNFAIAAPVIPPKVTYPNAAGITWTRGDDYTITWQGFATANVRIQLWKNWALVSTITTGTPNDGSYTWTVPTGTALGSDYLIRVSETATGWRPDFSNNPFTIAGSGGGEITRRAVVVGISDYVGTGSDLNYCDDDAEDFAAALAARSNWDAGNITTLLDRNATAANIWAALGTMSAASDSNDQCVFFFSGHGGWSSDQAPIDEANGRDEYICETNLTNNIYDDALGQWVTDLPTTNVLVVLCSCFSGGFIKGENSVKCISGAQPDGDGSGFATEIQAAMDAKLAAVKDVDDAAAGVTLTAADYFETCQESSTLQHDVFNHYVLQAMAGAGDANSDGTITAEEIYAYAAPLATSFNSGQHAQIYDADPGQGFVVLY